jgi:hypothetical protein
MKTIVILLFVLGALFVSIGYNKKYSVCPNPTIEYRFIPRTLYDEQLSDPTVLKDFSDMFNKETNWITNRNIEEPVPNPDSNFYKKLVI